MRVHPFVMALALLSALVLPAAAAPEDLLPADVIMDPDKLEIRKVYEVPVETDPSVLPRDDFERDGVLYSCTDILREVVMGSETKTVTESEETESPKKDMESLLELLPQEKETETEDGFSGTLQLVLDSIKAEPAGYGSSTTPVSTTRSYPNLSSQDTNHLPKSVTESGLTLTLQNVSWQTDNTYNADDYEIGNRFTAICTYGGSRTTSYVTKYTVTADYRGELSRDGVSLMRYTVIYNGICVEPLEPEPEPVPEPAPEPEPEPAVEPEPAPPEEEQPDKPPAEDETQAFPWLAVIGAGAAGLAAGAGGVFFLKRKEHDAYEKTVLPHRGDGYDRFGDDYDGDGE